MFVPVRAAPFPIEFTVLFKPRDFESLLCLESTALVRVSSRYIFTLFNNTGTRLSIKHYGESLTGNEFDLYSAFWKAVHDLKGLSHEIDFKTFDKNLQNLA